MKLIDANLGHEVGEVTDQLIVDRWGNEYPRDGYAVVNSSGEFVGSYVDGKFYNAVGQLMAVLEALGNE